MNVVAIIVDKKPASCYECWEFSQLRDEPQPAIHCLITHHANDITSNKREVHCPLVTAKEYKEKA